MNNRVRIESNEAVVRNAGIFLRGDDDEWVDVRKAVASAEITLRVGEISRASLDVILTEAYVEAFSVDERTLKAFASVLRLEGWKVEEPEEEQE